MAPTAMHQDRKGFFWMLGSGPLPNERRGDVMLVHVRGELEHHASDSYGCAESYEGIRAKMVAAFAGEVDGDHDEDDTPAVPPKSIIMVIDSPGGVVSGLNETVKALQRMRAEHPDVRTVAYCNEMAASAAYALACSCERIIAPPSAIVGSIGVISTMVSQARKDAKDGYDVRLLTSGARKADGHPHAPLSDKAAEVEQKRVDKLAAAFFAIASKARGMSVDKIRALEAGIFLGKDAIKVKLVDEVKSLDDVIAEATAETTGKTVTASGGNQTDRKVKMNLAALIKKTEAAIAKEKDPKKLLSLAANLEAYKKTEKHIEHVKTEEGADEGEEEAEESAADESDEEEASASEEEEKAEFPKKDDDDDDDDDDGEDEKKSSKASLAFRSAVEELTGMRGKKALGALRAIAGAHVENTARIQRLEAERKKDAKASLIAGARGKYLTKAEAAWLASQPMATVEGFVAMRRKSGVIVHTDETTIVKPKQAAPGTEESLSPERLESIEAAVAGYSGDKKTFRAALVEAHLADHKTNVNAALNGAGRY